MFTSQVHHVQIAMRAFGTLFYSAFQATFHMSKTETKQVYNTSIQCGNLSVYFLNLSSIILHVRPLYLNTFPYGKQNLLFLIAVSTSPLVEYISRSSTSFPGSLGWAIQLQDGGDSDQRNNGRLFLARHLVDSPRPKRPP